MRMCTYAQDGTVMSSTWPAHFTSVRRFAPDIAMAMEFRPDDSPGLPSTFFMRTGKYQCNVPGWQTHRRTYAIAHSFLQLLHQENGLSPTGKTLTNEIYFFLKTLHGNVTAHASFHLNTSSPMHTIATETHPNDL